jgi:hypothetical protein
MPEFAAHHEGMDVKTRAFQIVQQSIGEVPIKKRQPAMAQRGAKPV